MYKNHKISVSIPAYNEANFIVETMKNLPEFVDHIIVANDCSKDNTSEVVKKYLKKDKRVILIDREINAGGPGLPIQDAHQTGIELGADILVVVNGDNQMDPAYLHKLLDKLIEERFDYAKGNRFFHLQDLKKMPKLRLYGNIFVSFLNKFSTGYWSISDPLNGYTAIRVPIYQLLEKSKLAKKYDFEVSMFTNLAMVDAKISDVFIPAIYGNEVSHVNLVKDTFRVTKVLFFGFLTRMFVKKLLFNMSLVPIYYFISFMLLVWSLVYGSWVISVTLGPPVASTGTVMLAVIPFILGIQFLLQAITLDISSEPKSY